MSGSVFKGLVGFLGAVFTVAFCALVVLAFLERPNIIDALAAGFADLEPGDAEAIVEQDWLFSD